MSGEGAVAAMRSSWPRAVRVGSQSSCRIHSHPSTVSEAASPSTRDSSRPRLTASAKGVSAGNVDDAINEPVSLGTVQHLAGVVARPGVEGHDETGTRVEPGDGGQGPGEPTLGVVGDEQGDHVARVEHGLGLVGLLVRPGPRVVGGLEVADRVPTGRRNRAHPTPRSRACPRRGTRRDPSRVTGRIAPRLYLPWMGVGAPPRYPTGSAFAAFPTVAPGMRDRPISAIVRRGGAACAAPAR